MSGKKKVRVVLDALLTVMLVFEMFIQFTGELLHEVVGFAFFATLIVHMALSARWTKGTIAAGRSGKLHGKRAALAVMGVLLALDTLVLGVSSVAISGLLASAGMVWTLGSYAMWATVHAVSSYALCGLVAVHLAMHWTFVAAAFKVPYDPSRRQAISAGVHATAAVGALALGILAVRQGMPESMASQASAEPTSPTASLESVAPDAGTGSGSSASSGSESGRGAHGARKKDGSQTASPQASSPQTGSSQTDGSQSSGAEGSSSATGICTLCRKQCPLSAPRCDKPYEAGLI